MSHVKARSTSNGFTLVELLLAMSFIAVLMLAIATVTLLISQVYNRGLTLKEVNEISRTVSDDITRDISNSATFSLTAGGGQYVNSNPTGTPGQAATGRLCLGTYSYIWNYGWALAQSNAGVSTYNGKSDPIHLVRVPDGDGSYCAVDGAGKLLKAQVDPANAVELIDQSDHNLVIHQFAVTSSSTAQDSLTGQRLYSVTFTIGTNDQNAIETDPTTGVMSCKPTSVAGADLSYCSVQQFSLVARTQHGVN